MESWSIGVTEYWNNGTMEYGTNSPLLDLEFS
jgi:hypothetical protein